MMTKKKKGHWPAGKRRKLPTGTSVVRALRRLVDRLGLRPSARLIGVDPRTVKRWMTEERYPSAEEVRMIHGADAQC